VGNISGGSPILVARRQWVFNIKLDHREEYRCSISVIVFTCKFRIKMAIIMAIIKLI
jgi:hypothetical protein